MEFQSIVLTLVSLISLLSGCLASNSPSGSSSSNSTNKGRKKSPENQLNDLLTALLVGISGTDSKDNFAEKFHTRFPATKYPILYQPAEASNLAEFLRRKHEMVHSLHSYARIFLLENLKIFEQDSDHQKRAMQKFSKFTGGNRANYVLWIRANLGKCPKLSQKLQEEWIEENFPQYRIIVPQLGDQVEEEHPLENQDLEKSPVHEKSSSDDYNSLSWSETILGDNLCGLDEDQDSIDRTQKPKLKDHSTTITTIPSTLTPPSSPQDIVKQPSPSQLNEPKQDQSSDTVPSHIPISTCISNSKPASLSVSSGSRAEESNVHLSENQRSTRDNQEKTNSIENETIIKDKASLKDKGSIGDNIIEGKSMAAHGPQKLFVEDQIDSQASNDSSSESTTELIEEPTLKVPSNPAPLQRIDDLEALILSHKRLIKLRGQSFHYPDSLSEIKQLLHHFE